MTSPAITVLEQTPGFLRALLAPATAEQMEWRPAPDRWSIAMVLAHLADVEVKGFGQRFFAIAGQDSPFLPAYDQLALFAGGVPEIDAAEQLDMFAERRKQSLAWLHTLPETVTARTGRHEELGIVTFGQMLNEFALHDLGHIRQVAEIYRARAFYPNIGPFARYYRMNP
jgi:DinB superfamily